MTKADWDELYMRIYAAYEYAGWRNEYTRSNLGELLDYMIQYKERYTKPV